MVCRILLLCLPCLLLAAPLQAEPTVFFRGKQLTFRHYVYGEVIASSRSYGTVNLGFAHGIQEEQTVAVVRRSQGQLFPIGILRMQRVRPGESLGEYEGAFRLKREDLVVVSARELDLWQGTSRSEQLVMKSLMSRNQKGYDTGAIPLRLQNEVGHDDDVLWKRPDPLHVNLDDFSRRRPKLIIPIIRGAFRPADGEEDGAADSLSAKDRKAAPDQPTLDLETAMARYISTSAAGKMVVDQETLRMMAQDRPGVVDLDEIQEDLDRENKRVHKTLQP